MQCLSSTAENGPNADCESNEERISDSEENFESRQIVLEERIATSESSVNVERIASDDEWSNEVYEKLSEVIFSLPTRKRIWVKLHEAYTHMSIGSLSKNGVRLRMERHLQIRKRKREDRTNECALSDEKENSVENQNQNSVDGTKKACPTCRKKKKACSPHSVNPHCVLRVEREQAGRKNESGRLVQKPIEFFSNSSSQNHP